MLGCRVDFESDHRDLMQLAVHAFAGLPAHRLARAPPLRVRLRLAASDSVWPRNGPPAPVLSGGAGILCGTIDARNFALVVPAAGAALVSASRSMLAHPVTLRYELIEFALLTLAARANRLMPLHAACLGLNGRGALVLGASGAGKSTLALQSVLHGLDFLAEDSLFVDAHLRATAVSAFLHIRCDARGARETAAVRLLRRAPVIRRRSGVRKYEVDLRRARVPLARAPLRLAAVVVLSARRAGAHPLLRPLTARGLLLALRREQPYAATQPGWVRFCRQLRALPAFEMRRGRQPRDSALALRAMLSQSGEPR